MKNKIFIILLSVTFVFSTAVFAVEEELVPVGEPVAVETVSEDTIFNQSADDDIKEITEVDVQEPALPHKKPISKRELLKKFLIAMVLVGGFSLILYFGLFSYNKIREIDKKQISTPEKDTPLVTPNDFDSAVKTFLERTEWDN